MIKSIIKQTQKHNKNWKMKSIKLKNLLVFSQDGFPIFKMKEMKSCDFGLMSGFFSAISIYFDALSKDDPFYMIQTSSNTIAFRKCFSKDIIIAVITEQDEKEKRIKKELDLIADIVESSVDRKEFSKMKGDTSIYSNLERQLSSVVSCW